MPMLLASIVLSYAAAAALYPALYLGRLPRVIAWLGASAAVSLSPFLISRNTPLLRMISVLVAIGLLVKLYDAWRDAQPALRGGFWSYAFFLPNSLWLLRRRKPELPPKHSDTRMFMASGLSAATLIVACAFMFKLDWSAIPFLLEHAAKASAVVMAVILAANALAAAYRLLGGQGLTPMHSPYTAATPAEFWRRWNRPAQQFFHEYGFKAMGGMRRPFVATLSAFAISGLVHEYVFGMASGRFQGWQFLFFMTQGCAAAATMRSRPTGWRRTAGVAATLAFNLLTSVLFFQSVNAVLPFYAPRK